MRIQSGHVVIFLTSLLAFYSLRATAGESHSDVPSPAPRARLITAENELDADLEKEGLERGKELSILTTPPADYPKQSAFFRGQRYFPGAYLVIYPGDNLEEMARTLAMNGDPSELRARLEQAERLGERKIPLGVLQALVPLLPTGLSSQVGTRCRTQSSGPSSGVPLKSLLPRGLEGVLAVKRVPLEETLPPFAREHLNTRATQDGPNCWNTTLNFHDPTVGVHYTSPSEVAAELHHKYRRLGKGDTLRFGDVIAIWRHKYLAMSGLGALHTVVYLGNDLVFHKGSISAKDPYVFERFGEHMTFYRRGLGGGMIAVTFHRPRSAEAEAPASAPGAQGQDPKVPVH